MKYTMRALTINPFAMEKKPGFAASGAAPASPSAAACYRRIKRFLVKLNSYS